MSNIKKFRIKYFKKDNSILKLEKISLKFGRKIILDNLNLSLSKGQILGLLGPNGVGKSTIFNLITGLLNPDYGNIKIDSKVVNEFPIYQRTQRFKIGFVPQYGGFFHDLSVYDNLKAISEITEKNTNFRMEKINSLISKFELDSTRDIKAKFYPVVKKTCNCYCINIRAQNTSFGRTICCFRYFNYKNTSRNYCEFANFK